MLQDRKVLLLPPLRQGSQPDSAGWVDSPAVRRVVARRLVSFTLITTLAASRFEVGPMVGSEFVSLRSIRSHTSGVVDFALFGRPPPFLPVSF